MKERINKNRKFQLSFFGLWFLGLLIFAFSCEKYSFDPPSVDPNEEISFQEVLIPIFESKCAGCHNGSVPPDLRPDEAYESLTGSTRYITDDPENKAEESLIYTKLNEGHAPGISEVELLQILYWVQQGAENN
ncbi:MAG: hypothetical protein ACP5E3_03475 [Bacteroidales bacterium]